ncbi:MAG: hypothetical protein FWF00_04690 [Endomicrobia bacterium]|nr:hypothetical protein [Endomicrobiia bacterium]MCL2506968.1 hypothetical protein [Endomicrobiia bacterium]
MKGFVCKVCGFVSLEGKLEVCPICHMKNVIEEQEDAYKMPDFKAEKGESEKKHIPFFAVSDQCELIPGAACIDVHVRIGEILHPAAPEHHITNITFYLDNKFITWVELTSDVNPAAVVHLKIGTKGKVQVIENCNLHGRWYNEVEIQ